MVKKCRPKGRHGNVSEPISRALESATIYLDFASPQSSSTQPECTEGRPYGIPICACSRWGLPSYVVANALVRFYRTVSAFLLHAGESSFLWHCPSGRPAQPLAGILPLGARTFLMLAHAIARLTRGGSIHRSSNDVYGRRCGPIGHLILLLQAALTGEARLAPAFKAI